MTLGYLSLQSKPVRVSNCTRPPSMRADMRNSSSFISCSHCGPDGAVSTGEAELGRYPARKRRHSIPALARATGLGLRGRTLHERRHVTKLCANDSRLNTGSAAPNERPAGRQNIAEGGLTVARSPPSGRPAVRGGPRFQNQIANASVRPFAAVHAAPVRAENTTKRA